MHSVKSRHFSFPAAVTRLLVAVPHPDDETAYAAGIIKRASDSGTDVRVVCFTRGEKSTLRYGLAPDADLVSHRAAELAAALKILRATSHHIYDIPDGGIEDNTARTAAVFREEMQSFRPDLVLTLEPSGIYGHPDHIALSRTVTRETDQSGTLLGYLTVMPGYRQHPSTQHMAKDIDCVRPVEPEVEVILSPLDVLTKLRAFRSHRSQFSITPDFLYNWYTRRLLTREYLRYADRKVRD
ncbi:MAG: Mycothiol S-conjugate amidase [candidate division WS6 bacterium OLB20]|uniref:Mycothiol S-conjugate amidase n=1 Tax=candidate division WS6 bacterium OLB20 TaxID=1617426 RepID=A0A136M0L9_9BACT|nr:MAG: Mycothiol S-conjugate amidase [candidate division WS6 bacterium OLB20]